MMVARTVAIDEAVRAAASPQVVILGAGLDGRAWRMPELRDVTVFEVDHPDSQREKRARAAALQRIAREVRFVPVDFTRDRLDDALAAAGHDPTRPTTWVWEGVVMYLERADIEATLAVIQRRSAPASRLVMMYLFGPCCCPSLPSSCGGWASRCARCSPLTRCARCSRATVSRSRATKDCLRSRLACPPTWRGTRGS